MADFLMPSEENISNEVARFIAKIQCNMVEECPVNFKRSNTNMIYNICNKSELNQKHLLSCEKLLEKNEKVTYIPDYEEIFSKNLNEQVYVAKIMLENIKIKERIEQKL